MPSVTAINKKGVELTLTGSSVAELHKSLQSQTRLSKYV